MARTKITEEMIAGMSEEARDILAGLEDAIAYVRGDKSRGRVLHYDDVDMDDEPASKDVSSRSHSNGASNKNGL